MKRLLNLVPGGTGTVLVMVILAAGTAARGAEGKSAGAVDFARQIRPILSDNCFSCHGPDEKGRKAKLRLDDHESILAPAKSGKPAVVPGSPDRSELVNRIFTSDTDDVMPPPKSGKSLTAAQKELLKRWVAEGATWMNHWAFTAPKKAALPATQDSRWARNEIDRFILARLEKEGLKPSPAADKVTLIRRVTLDLTGLPPTPAEVDGFLADKRPDAYERLIDRLLASPRYGEHMAKYWLDAVRYADSHGYHIDSERSMWKYRDWVVQAYNRKMPFDQFTLEQLAGDLIPNATLDQKIASGYVRANMSTGEGGAIIEEYQAKYGFDRTETMGTIWMGMTLVCARCHTHKYDPIAQKEYYGLFSFFNTLRESVMDGNAPNPDPAIQVPTPEESRRLEELKKLIADGQSRIEAPAPALDERQAAWERGWRERLSRNWVVPQAASFHATSNAQFQVLGDSSVLVNGPNPPSDVYQVVFKPGAGTVAAFRLEALPDESLPQKSSARSDDGKFRLSEFEADWVLPGAQGKDAEPRPIKFARAFADGAIKDREVEKAIDGKADTGWQPTDAPMVERHTALFLPSEPVVLPENAELRVRLKSEASVNRRAIGRFRVALARDPELARLLTPPKPEPWQVLGPLKAGDVGETLSQELEPERKIDLAKAWPGVREEARWAARGDLEDGRDHVLVSSLHGVHGLFYLSRKLHLDRDENVEVSLRADDAFRIWVNGAMVGERTRRETVGEGPLRLTVKLHAGDNTLLVKMVNVQGDSRFGFRQSPLDESVLPSELAPLFAAGGQLTADQQSRARTYFRRAVSPEWRRDADQVALWREEQDGLNRSLPVTLVAREETEKPRDTFMLMRGEYDKVGDKVVRGTPSIFPPFPKEAPTNRLGLAKWLTLPTHPLTARVTVNRYWQQFFGIGIVKTSDDFGMQSDPPSHPELLDWIAADFVESGWNIQRVQKLMLMSATYQQSSRVTPELLKKDPENRLLARGPRFRVEGEVVRDTALFVSGLLVDRLGGRSAKPYEPPGLWEAVSYNNAQKYVPDEGEGQYRRSLYTNWKRQSPPPNMLIFDAPTREFCVVRRPRTNTPLQALALLNDPQFVEASRAFADRILREGGKTTESRLAYAFRLATARKPSADELRILSQTLEAQRAAFGSNPDSARQLLGVGAYRATSGVSESDLAAWATVTSMILNLDETVTKI
jgi:hypothetical protein